jgi:hypothetical protein
MLDTPVIFIEFRTEFLDVVRPRSRQIKLPEPHTPNFAFAQLTLPYAQNDIGRYFNVSGQTIGNFRRHQPIDDRSFRDNHWYEILRLICAPQLWDRWGDELIARAGRQEHPNKSPRRHIDIKSSSYRDYCQGVRRGLYLHM